LGSGERMTMPLGKTTFVPIRCNVAVVIAPTGT
jgi:hypothetical protein